MSILCLTIFALIATAYANDGWNTEVTNEQNVNDVEPSASGVIKTGGLPDSVKAGYGLPLPPLSALTAATGNYAAYVNALGLGNPYAFAYNRYGMMPYSAYGYGSPYGNYGYGSSFVPGAYNAAYGYGSPYYGRAAYAPYGYSYPTYAGLGYRYGGLGYGPSAVKATMVSSAAPVLNAPAPILNAPAPILNAPAPILNAPAPSVVNVPTAQVVNAPSSVAIPASLPSVPAYRGPVVATQNKDGSIRYAYAPAAGQALPVYK